MAGKPRPPHGRSSPARVDNARARVAYDKVARFTGFIFYAYPL